MFGIAPYVKNFQVLRCPNESWDLGGYGLYFPDLNYPTERLMCSYGLNLNLGYASRRYKLAEIRRPSECILIADSGPHLNSARTSASSEHVQYLNNAPPEPPDDVQSNPALANRWFIESHAVYLRHNMTANAGFVDGHAKAVNRGFVVDANNWTRD